MFADNELHTEQQQEKKEENRQREGKLELNAAQWSFWWFLLAPTQIKILMRLRIIKSPSSLNEVMRH